MNKQEVIQKINDSKFCSRTIALTYQSECFNQGMDAALKIISKLDEPQKVKVPEFVVEWFEENKHNLNFAIYELCEAGKVPVDLYEGLTDFERWFYLNHDIDTLIRMQDGYEVEEEPKYYLDLPKMGMVNEISNSQLCWTNCEGGITEKEIKAIDERYWPFAVPVEKV